MPSSPSLSSVVAIAALLPALLNAMALPEIHDVNLADLYKRSLSHRQDGDTLFSEGDRKDSNCISTEPLFQVGSAATRKTFLSGNGRPHQNYLYRQISNNMGCDLEGGNTCEMSREQSHTTGFAWSINVGVGINGGTSAIQGGLSVGFGYEVSESTTSGEIATCAGNPGDTICSWWREAHTVFKVYDVEYCNGKETSRGEEYSVLVPNKNGQGSAFLCGTTTIDQSVFKCRHQGFEFWNDNGNPQGGPRVFPPGGDGLRPPHPCDNPGGVLGILPGNLGTLYCLQYGGYIL